MGIDKPYTPDPNAMGEKEKISYETIEDVLNTTNGWIKEDRVSKSDMDAVRKMAERRDPEFMKHYQQFLQHELHDSSLALFRWPEGFSELDPEFHTKDREWRMLTTENVLRLHNEKNSDITWLLGDKEIGQGFTPTLHLDDNLEINANIQEYHMSLADALSRASDAVTPTVLVRCIMLPSVQEKLHELAVAQKTGKDVSEEEEEMLRVIYTLREKIGEAAVRDSDPELLSVLPALDDALTRNVEALDLIADKWWIDDDVRAWPNSAQGLTEVSKKQ